MSRKRGERNWDDNLGYSLNTDHVPNHFIRELRGATYRVTDQGNGWYYVTDGQDEWSVSLSCDKVLTIEERSYPNKRCDLAVLKAVKRIMR